MLESTAASRITDALFGPIENRERADDLSRVLVIVVLVLALAESPFALIFGPGAIVVAALEVGLGILVWWRKSIPAASALLVIALVATYVVLETVFREESHAAAWALVFTLVGVWVGAAAVHCTVAFRRLTKPASEAQA